MERVKLYMFCYCFQVLSSSVKIAFGLSPTLQEATASTQIFVFMMDRFFDCLNVRRLGQDTMTRKPELAPYTSTSDWRFNVSNDTNEFINDFFFYISLAWLTDRQWQRHIIEIKFKVVLIA